MSGWRHWCILITNTITCMASAFIRPIENKVTFFLGGGGRAGSFITDVGVQITHIYLI